MRATKRHRPLNRTLDPHPDVDWGERASRARYVGSPEHKDGPSFAGHPAPRADASICDRRLATQLPLVTSWLREGLQRAAVSGLMEGEFPRYVWYRDGDTAYEARLTNKELGEYKGYPLNPDEWPDGLADVFPAQEPAAENDRAEHGP